MRVNVTIGVFIFSVWDLCWSEVLINFIFGLDKHNPGCIFGLDKSNPDVFILFGLDKFSRNLLLFGLDKSDPDFILCGVDKSDAPDFILLGLDKFNPGCILGLDKSNPGWTNISNGSWWKVVCLIPKGGGWDFCNNKLSRGAFNNLI